MNTGFSSKSTAIQRNGESIMHANKQKSMSDMRSFYSTKVYYAEEKCENNNHSRGKKSQ